MMPPSIIDIETSGFGAGSYPIEVDYVTHHGNCWCSLITPCDDGQHWNLVPERLHHISRDTLLAHGKSIETVTTQLNEAFHDLVIYTDG